MRLSPGIEPEQEVSGRKRKTGKRKEKSGRKRVEGIGEEEELDEECS